jgi:hypothetical protein
MEIEEELVEGYSRIKALINLLLGDRSRLCFEDTQKLAIIAGLKLVKFGGKVVVIDGDRRTHLTLREAYTYCVKRIL